VVEVDATFYILKGAVLTQIVWDLRTPPKAVRPQNEQRLGSRVVERAGSAARLPIFNSESIAAALRRHCTGAVVNAADAIVRAASHKRSIDAVASASHT